MLHFLTLVFLFADPVVELPDVPAEWPDDTRAAIKAYADELEPLRDSAIEEAEKDLANAKKIRPSNNTDKRNKTFLIETRTARLQHLKARAILPHRKINQYTAKKGDVGIIALSGTVNQIVDGDLHVTLQAFDSKQDAILKGVKTDDLVDGARIGLNDLMEHIGPQSYTTVTGANRTVIGYRKLPFADKLHEWEKLRIAAYDAAVAEAKKKPKTKAKAM